MRSIDSNARNQYVNVDDGRPVSSPATDGVEMSTAVRMGGSFLWMQLLRMVEVGTSVLFLILVVRRLGPVEYGVFGIIMSTTATANMIAMFGFSEALNKFVAELVSQNKQDAVSALAQRVIAAGLLFALFCSAILWVGREQIAVLLKYRGMADLYPVIAVIVLSQTLSGLLSALNVGLWRSGIVFAITGAVNVLSVMGAVLAIYMGYATGMAAAVATAISFALGAVAFIIASEDCLLRRVKSDVNMKTVWRFSFSAWLVRLSLFAMGSNVVVLLMCWLLGSESEVAFFNCAYVPLFRLQALILGWSASVLPSLSELRIKSGESSLTLPYRIYVKLVVAIAVPLFLFVAWHADPLIVCVFGKKFVQAGTSLRLYAVLSLASLLAGSGLTTLLLYALGKAKVVSIVRLGTALLHLGLCFWLIPKYRGLGAIIGIGSGAIVAAYLEILLAPADIRAQYPILFVTKSLAIAVLCISGISLFMPKTILGLISGGMICLITYAFLLGRWRPLDSDEKKILCKHPVISRMLTLFGVS